jgi:hypothetical protein
MKKISKILIMATLFCFTMVNAAEVTPLPPGTESKIGYLYVNSNIEIAPSSKRLMIMPHVELLVLDQNSDDFVLIFPGKLSAICCVVQKNATNMVLLRKTTHKNYVSFRGPLEVNTIPFQLNKGEELPVSKKSSESFAVEVDRKGVLLPLVIPANIEGIEFSVRSKFAKFAEKQKKRGLVYFNRQWIPKDDALAMHKLEKNFKLRNSQMWENLKRGAELGVVVLKNGKVLNGRVTGNSADKILFESEKRDYLIGIDDAAAISFSEIMARDKIGKALCNLNKAKKLLKISGSDNLQKCSVANENRGPAMSHLQRALRELKNISSTTETEFKKAENMMTEISKITKTINRSLAKDNEAIYHDTVFPVEVLNYHLKRGDTLLRKKFWLKPDQLCDECRATGKLICPTCYGAGKLKKDCPDCIAGRIVCAICQGSGRKKCSYCGGKGYIYIEKKQSTVVASFGGYGDYGGYNPPCGGGTTLYSKGRYMVFQPGNYYNYPRYGGSSLSVGSEEKRVKKVCPVCQGTGTVACPETIKCAKCNGVGYFIEICPTCSGNKTIPCKKCNGKGFYGEPQKDPEKLDASKNKEPKGSGSYFNAPVAIP